MRIDSVRALLLGLGALGAGLTSQAASADTFTYKFYVSNPNPYPITFSIENGTTETIPARAGEMGGPLVSIIPVPQNYPSTAKYLTLTVRLALGTNRCIYEVDVMPKKSTEIVVAKSLGVTCKGDTLSLFTNVKKGYGAYSISLKQNVN